MKKEELIRENLRRQRELNETLLNFIESNFEEEENIYADLQFIKY